MLNFDADYQTQDHHQLSVGITAVVLPAVTTEVLIKPEKIHIQADPRNSAVIVLGSSTVTANGANGGFVLSPGADMILPNHTIADWYAISDVAAQKLQVTYMKGGY